MSGLQSSQSNILPLLSLSREGTQMNDVNNTSGTKNADDQIEILDYSHDTTTETLFTQNGLMTLNDNDPSTTLTPKVPSIIQVVGYLNNLPQDTMNIDNIYGQQVKVAKLSTSDTLISYPQHANHTSKQTSEHPHGFSTSSIPSNTISTSFVDPISGAAIPVQSKSLYKLQQNQDSEQPSLATIQHHVATDAARRGAAMSMGSINVTTDGNYYLMDNSLSDALVDGLYGEMSSSLGVEFVEYISSIATLPTGAPASPQAPPLPPPSPTHIAEEDVVDQYGMLSSLNDSQSPDSDTVIPQISQQKSINQKKPILLKTKQTSSKTTPTRINLASHSLVTPSAIYNQYDLSIDRALYKTHKNASSTTTALSPRTEKDSSSDLANYQQPTFEPFPAPVGTSIAQTKDHNSMLFIPSIEEPLSKTTFEQITFLTGFWPQGVRFLVCALTGAAVAAITYLVEVVIGYLVMFLHWILTAVLQTNNGQGVVGYGFLTSLFTPIAAMVAVTLLVTVYWVPGVTMVYYAGIFALKGSGLPALNAYFDGSYDQNIPLFGTNVLFAKLISLSLSLGGLLKSGVQGPLITTGSMVARSMLQIILKIINMQIIHKCFVYLCCCCFDRHGHSRSILSKLPWNRHTLHKQTSYIQSQHEQEGLLNDGDETQKNKKIKQRYTDSADDQYIFDFDDESTHYEDSWVDVDRELREHNIQRYSPPTTGTGADVENEMVNRINILSNNHNNIITFQQNQELRVTRLKRKTMGNTNIQSSETSSSHVEPTGIEYQFHNASKIATSTQHPSAAGNNFNTVQSLTLSSRIELITRSLSGPQDEHDMLACGATAGFTCAFNAPLAAMVMVQSMLKQQFSFQLTLRMFFTALIAVVVSNLLRSDSNLPDRGFLDLDIPQIHAMPASELYLCIILGVLGGLLGVFIIKFNKGLTKWRIVNYHDKFIPNIQLTILIAMLMIIPGVLLTVAAPCTPITEESFPVCIDHSSRCLQLSCPNGQFSQIGSLMFGTPERLLRLVWDRSNDPANDFSPVVLTVFFLMYILLASASFLGAFPGGFFMPAIIIGAMFGRIFSRFINYMFPQYYYLSVGVYATLGSVALLASINRITLPIVAMMVEFTSDVQFLTPIMIVILCAKFIADFFCLGLEAEVNKLQPRVTMAMADEMNPILGHVTAKDILSINTSIHGYSQSCNNDEVYPGHNDFAVVGEVDSIHRIQALLEMTTHSSFPVVTVVPNNVDFKNNHFSSKSSHGSSNNGQCEFNYVTLSLRIYLRSLLKSLLSSINKDSAAAPNNVALSHTTVSLLQSLLTAIPSSHAALGENITAQINFIIDNNTVNKTALNGLIAHLQSYYDDVYLTECPCCSTTSVSSTAQASMKLNNVDHLTQTGKFIGLITRRSLKAVIEKSVDYTRATRIINSGNLRNLYHANNDDSDRLVINPQDMLQENCEKDQESPQNKETSGWWSRLAAKFKTKSLDNTTDAPYMMDGVTAQIDANKRQEQLDLVVDNTLSPKANDGNNNNNDANNSDTRSPPQSRQIRSKVQNNKSKQSRKPSNKHQIKCQCLRCTTHHWALIRYHTPILALLQHQMSKKRLFPLIAYCYLKLSIVLKRYVYKHGLNVALNNTENTAPLYTLQHPVLLHRELLSTVINYIQSIYIKLPQLPYFIQDNIIRLASQAQAPQPLSDENLASTPQPDTIEEVFSPGNTTIDTQANSSRLRFSQDPKFVSPFIRFITWLEERSQIRYSIQNPTQRPNKNLASNSDIFNNLGISATTLCVSLVNTLPLVDIGVYTTSYHTSGARLFRLFRSVGMARVVVVNDNNQPIGIITRKDMVRADKYLSKQLSSLKSKLKQE